MVGTAIILQAAELVGWGILWRKLKADAETQILIYGKPQPQRIPIIDAKLQQLSGYPNKMEKAIGSRIIGMTRRVVNTRAFEYLVYGVVNRRSKLHRIAKKPPKVVLL